VAHANQYTFATVEARFWSKVDRRGPDECWPFLAHIRRVNGYGLFDLNGVTRTAHSVAWELTNGPLPDHAPIACHSCDVRYPLGSVEYRKCCNPAHVFPGTDATNIADRDAKGRTASGDRHGTRTRPESVARGDRNGSRTRPESRPRGERVAGSKLTVAGVLVIRRRLSLGERPCRIAADMGVGSWVVRAIQHGDAWAWVEGRQ